MDLTCKTFKEKFINFIAGLFIGLSVIVPGISGSAIAMSLKVYDKIIFCFSNIFKEFKKCFFYLIPAALGIVIGFFAGFFLVRFLLEIAPFITVCFFVGLMIGTFPTLFKEIKGEKLDLKRKLLFSLGFIIPIFLAIISMNLSSNNNFENINALTYILFFIVGILISLTQLIPGLSATALLMILGYYTALMNGISRDILSNIPFMLVYVVMVLGFGVGVLLFSKLIEKVLNKNRVNFFFLICALSIGSCISVLLGQDALVIYKSWTSDVIFREILFGVISLVIGFVSIFILFRKENNEL